MKKRSFIKTTAALAAAAAFGSAQAQTTPIKFQLDWRFEGPAALFLVPAAKVKDLDKERDRVVRRLANAAQDMSMQLAQFKLLAMDRWAALKEPWTLHERLDTYYYAWDVFTHSAANYWEGPNLFPTPIPPPPRPHPARVRRRARRGWGGWRARRGDPG